MRIIHSKSISVVDVMRMRLQHNRDKGKMRIEGKGSYGNEFIIDVNAMNDVFSEEKEE